jgi:hypothetical protein
MKMMLTEFALLCATIVLAASCSSSNGNPPPDLSNAACSTPSSRCSGTCAPGGCLTTLASLQNQPSAIAVRDSSVYWTTSGPCPADGGDCKDYGTVVMAPVGGGQVKTLASKQNLPWAIVADGESVYWVDDNAAGAVLRAPLGGGDLTTLASGQNNPDSIAVDATNVYWTTAGTLAQGNVMASTGTVMEVPLAGGKAKALASEQNLPHGIVVQGTSLFWATEGLETGAAASGTVMSVSLTSGKVSTIASAENAVSLAADSESVYWTNAGSVPYDGTVVKYSRAKKAVTSLATGQSLPSGIALDAQNVYWLTEAGDVLRCSLKDGCPKDPEGGTAPTLLASGQNGPVSIAVVESSVYWTNFADPGTVMRLTVAPKD